MSSFATNRGKSKKTDCMIINIVENIVENRKLIDFTDRGSKEEEGLSGIDINQYL